MQRVNSRHPSDHAEREPVERLERILDEALRAATAPTPPVDLRARVIAAIDRDEALGAESTRRVVPWRPAVALTGVVALAVTILVVSRPGEQAGRGGDAHGTTATATAPQAAAPHPAPTTEEPPDVAGIARGTAAASRPSGVGRTTAGRAWLQRLRQPIPGAEAAVVPEEHLAAAAESYMPGAPAGELGDPLQPLPVPPPITIVPITQQPIEAGALISQVSRPVTEFTTDDTQPGARSRDAGRSGGSSR